MATRLLDHLVLVGRERANPRTLARDVERGVRIRVTRGAYYDASKWQSLLPAERHRVTIEALAHRRPHLVFSHYSAAVLHGIPLVGPFPARVHVISSRTTGGRSDLGVQHHCVGITADEVIAVDGLMSTSPIRTVVDLATVQPFRWGIAGADHLLHTGSATTEALIDGLHRADVRHGGAHARRTLEFADVRSANAGESMSRAVIHEWGFPRPELQCRHAMASGRVYFTDFEWPEYRLAGEFDGAGKYLGAELLQAMTPAEAVIAEKRREDELRATGLRFARWGWGNAMARGPVREVLLAAGLPRIRG